MLTWKWKYWLLLAPVLLTGCAHGFDRAALRERMNTNMVQSTDSTIAEARNLKPQLNFPCRIAVYVKPSNDSDWHWTAEDRAALEQWSATLRKEGIVSDIFLLPDLLVGKGENLKELRLAAAQCGADALFVIHGAAQTDSYKNFASVFNITVVGGYLVPASHKDSLFMMQGILLDVDNGYIYAGVQSEGIGKIIRPTFTIEDRDSIMQAKANAVPQFSNEVVRRMRALSTLNTRRPTAIEEKDAPQTKETKEATQTSAKAGTLSSLLPQKKLPAPVVTTELAPGYGLGTIRDAVRQLASTPHIPVAGTGKITVTEIRP